MTPGRPMRDREPRRVGDPRTEGAPRAHGPGPQGPARRDPASATPATLAAVEIAGLGVDICEIARMERALERHPSMRERVFTDEERTYCERKARPAESYAGRFAAREAVLKALGGYPRRGWKDISVVRAPSGAPAIRLVGNALRRAESLGVSEVLVTFTHEKTNAVAFAVAVRP